VFVFVEKKEQYLFLLLNEWRWLNLAIAKWAETLLQWDLFDVRVPNVLVPLTNVQIRDQNAIYNFELDFQNKLLSNLDPYF